MAVRVENLYFPVSDSVALKIYWKFGIPNFDEISQSMADIKLLPVYKARTVAILEFYFRFRF